MAIAMRVINETSGGAGSVSFDFVYDVLASENNYPISDDSEWYFKLNTSVKEKQVVSGVAIPVKIMKTLTDLSLNGAKQSRSNTAAAYTSITDMVEDYLFDTIQGHTANQFSSGVAAQGAMDI